MKSTEQPSGNKRLTVTRSVAEGSCAGGTMPPCQGPIQFDWLSGHMDGPSLEGACKKLGQIESLFGDRVAASQLDPETVIYRVQSWLPVPAGTAGGLFWGVTTIEPGTVGDEYFMTHGHFHENRASAEFYSTLRGQGMLVLMDRGGRTWSEPMHAGSLHYISGDIAHRVVNTGDAPLVFAGCWPSDAGHDYAAIRARGFGARVRRVDGQPALVLETRDESAGH